jgi:hypothetical protein
VAALIRSYFPRLTARQVKFAIERSALHLTDSSILVKQPGTGQVVKLNALCSSAGFVNAWAAVQLAAEMKPEATGVETAVKTGKVNTKN